MMIFDRDEPPTIHKGDAPKVVGELRRVGFGFLRSSRRNDDRQEGHAVRSEARRARVRGANQGKHQQPGENW
jgi:hypothetical protein